MIYIKYGVPVCKFTKFSKFQIRCWNKCKETFDKGAELRQFPVVIANNFMYSLAASAVNKFYKLLASEN